MNYDVVIIGAGPAGIAAAHNLINNKISCLLIDKQEFPRNKLCAGGITYKTFELIKSLKLENEFNLDNAVISEGANLYLEYKYISEMKTKGLTYLVDRFEFDNYLVEEYKTKGGKLLEGVKVEKIDTKRNKIFLSNKEEISFKYIIGADGAVGITSKIIDKNYKANGFCLQVEIDRNEFNYKGNNMSLYYGVIHSGYGWIFPKKDTLTIGFGGNYNKKIEYEKEFQIFLHKLGIVCDRKQFRGTFLPFGNYIKNTINNEKNLLLVGDAAGLVDPITGEGIYFAMLSGIKASNVIIKSLQKNHNEVEKYVEEIFEITKNISKGEKLKNWVYKFRKLVFYAMKNKKIANLIFNKCLYESNYDLLKLLLNKNKKLCSK